MLTRLSIQNYAIITRLDVDFSDQLNIITGETGAGKSIIMGALSLILGQRADTNSLLDREKKCVVEGFFTVQNDAAIQQFLASEDLDASDEIVVRREIAPSGKSRAFINDTPVNLTQLNALSSLLVDLHQQFDTLELGDSDFQRDVLDALAGNATLLQSYKKAYNAAQAAIKKRDALTAQKKEFDKETGYHQFQFDELQEAGLRENLLEDLDAELQLLTHAEGIKTALAKTYFELEESETPIVRQLKSLANGLQSFSSMHAQLPALQQRLQSAYIELQDIASEAERLHDEVSTDEAAIERINEKLSLGYRLLKKHGVQTTNELLGIQRSLAEKLQAVLNIDDAIAAAEKEAEQLKTQANALAEKLTAARKKVVAPLEQQVNKMLAQVGMPNARLKADMQPAALQNDGSDNIEFLFDANKKGTFAPLRKVASGGELSRLMLCIKSLVATSMNLPTLIFDEIDTGISGEAAKQVGIILKDLAAARQVICITHQPQIAGRAHAHYLVYKAVERDAITTGVKKLNEEERIMAIAKMLSGEKPTAAAMENAREMVMQ